MTLQITCPACSASFRLKEDARGKKMFCPKCGRSMVITSGGVAKRGAAAHGAAALAVPGRDFPWGWLAAALLLSVAVVVMIMLATHRHKQKEEDTLVAATTGGETEAAGGRDKLLPFVPEPATEPKPIAKTDTRPAIPPEPKPIAKTDTRPAFTPEPMPEPGPRPRPPFLPVVPGIPDAGITYLFQDTLAAEEKGVPDLIPTDPLGKNGFETTSVFGRSQRVYRFSGNASPTEEQAGLTFDNSRGLLTRNNYSIEMVFVFLQKDNQWRRIVDVEDRQSDNGFYADPGNHLQVYPFPGIGNLVTAGTFRHAVLTTSNTGTVTAYLDGGLQFTASTPIMNIDNPRNVVHFFLDNTIGGGQFEFSDGKIALLRLYNEVLSGEQVSRLASAFRGTQAEAPDKLAEKNAAPDPGNLTGVQNPIGKTFYFRVTGSATGQIWGTDVYTADSNLATAAVHAGVLSPGATNVVCVKLVAGLSDYTGSTRNGVTSTAWGNFPAAYTVSRADPGRQPETPPAVPPSPESEPKPGLDKFGVIRLKEMPPVTTDNKSSLIKKYGRNLTLTASSTWGGWPPENAVDDNIKTSWFSAQNDAAAHGTKPWLQANFPTDVPVSRVTILGNRDPEWLVGFTILEGSVTLYDKNGKVLKTERNKGTGNYRDFDFRYNPPIKGVRAVRFTSLADQGNQTMFGDIAIAEIQVE